MVSNIKIVSVLLSLLILLLLASEGQAEEIDSGPTDEIDCVWHALQVLLPKGKLYTKATCVSFGNAVIAVSHVPCVKDALALDPVLDELAKRLSEYTTAKVCGTWTVDQMKSLITAGYFSLASETKAHMPEVLLMAVGGIILTKMHIF